MKDAEPSVIHLKDYQAPDFVIRKTYLEFELFEDYTRVTSSLDIEKQNSNQDTLVLAGQELELISIAIDNQPLSETQYKIESESLTLFGLSESFILTCETKIYPQKNTSLEGLYKSNKMFCTQCEAEGFRKITYYLDRPDVMSVFTTKIIADKQRYPILLSNGNNIEREELEEGRHSVTWHDPFKKPSYLFALVAGDLDVVEDSYMTASGNHVQLKIFVEEKDLDKCDHAMTSLKNAMKWDEEVYGREYDLDIFMIVAVDDFNMGAMENKGLNIFNTSCVLANPKTTTDAGFQRVEGVVAHEYFHNWSGNRVTCRDWFQLSLKEGFTVFRDAEFSADMGSRTVKRVEDVSLLRTMQFAEDAGPMAHPVQPSSFIEISNFYTLTIYEKGSEVVRMIHTLLGKELFRKGSDLYFSRHDGQAVTIEDFVKCMSEVSGRDFTQFMNWYKQAGTPKVRVSSEYDASSQTYSLTFTQSCPATPESEEKSPFVIPVAMGLLGDAGCLPIKVAGQKPNPETHDNTHHVIELTQEKETIVFNEVKEKPVPALLRGFSAPVRLEYAYTREELTRIMSHDDDGYCRWEASQELGIQVIREVMHAMTSSPSPRVDNLLLDAFKVILNDDRLDPAMVALMLKLPSEQYLAELSTQVDVESIHHARNRVERKIANSLRDDLIRNYERFNQEKNYDVSSQSIAARSLKNICLYYMSLAGHSDALAPCIQQLDSANNMTDELAALTILTHSAKEGVKETQSNALSQFYDKWKHETLVINHWFSVQVTKPSPDVIHNVKQLMQHEAFDLRNPNKIRSVLGSFAMRNPIGFHAPNGQGYAFLVDQIIHLNRSNPQIASRLLTPLTQWKKYDQGKQKMMKDQLLRLKAEASLSKDVFEVLDKSLN